jgi:hypothetical protein
MVSTVGESAESPRAAADEESHVDREHTKPAEPVSTMGHEALDRDIVARDDGRDLRRALNEGD